MHDRESKSVFTASSYFKSHERSKGLVFLPGNYSMFCQWTSRLVPALTGLNNYQGFFPPLNGRGY